MLLNVNLVVDVSVLTALTHAVVLVVHQAAVHHRHERVALTQSDITTAARTIVM